MNNYGIIIPREKLYMKSQLSLHRCQCVIMHHITQHAQAIYAMPCTHTYIHTLGWLQLSLFTASHESLIFYFPSDSKQLKDCPHMRMCACLCGCLCRFIREREREIEIFICYFFNSIPCYIFMSLKNLNS